MLRGESSVGRSRTLTRDELTRSRVTSRSATAAIVCLAGGASTNILAAYPRAITLWVLCLGGLLTMTLTATGAYFAKNDAEDRWARQRLFWVPPAIAVSGWAGADLLFPGFGPGIAACLGLSTLVGLAIGLGAEPC